MRRWMNITRVLIILIMFLLISGCQVKYEGNYDNGSTSNANITMGNGKFAFDNDFIYFTDRLNIYEYDCLSNNTISFNSKCDDVRSIYIQDEYVYFACNGLQRITKDGKKQQTVFEVDNCLQLIVEEQYAYYLDSVDGNLFQYELKEKSENILANNVLSYFIDEECIYVVAKIGKVPKLYVSSKEKIDLKEKVLSFMPISVVSKDDGLYLAERETYQIVKFDDGEEERLPIYSTYYQVIDNKIVYLDSETFENSCFSLVIYDEQTGQKKVICEEVYDFNILEDKYVCIQKSTGEYAQYLFYDLETQETKLMYGKGE